MPHRRVVFTFVTAVLAVAAAVTAGAPAQAAGTSRMNVWNSSHCLDNATEDSSKLQMWSCGSGSEQQWSTSYDQPTGQFTFANARTGLCITAPAAGAGTVTMAACDPFSDTQHWTVFAAANPLGPPPGWYDVWRNVSSGLCLATASVGNGTRPRTDDCDAQQSYQRWHQG